MAGHSHWKQIKHQKSAADERRGALFSKLLRAIAVAARSDPNPDFNPTLRTAIEKARENNVPQENIDRAIARGNSSETLEEVLMEAYGPGGSALLIHAITDNKNRTVQEVKALLKEHGAKWAEPGSVTWAFEAAPHGGWHAKFPQPIPQGDREKLAALTRVLEARDDVQRVLMNC